MTLPTGTKRELPKSKSGFTLIELLLVVIVLGIMAGMALPRFSGTFANFELSESAKNLAALMRYAQSRAIIKGKPQQLEFEEDYHRYRITQNTSSNEEETTDVFEKIPSRLGRTFVIAPAITVTASLSRIRFYPDGKIDKARIVLENNLKNAFTVSTQEQTGYVQIFDFKVE